MTNGQKLFKELNKTIVSKVKIGNSDFISVKGKGTIAIESLKGLKHISDVLCWKLFWLKYKRGVNWISKLFETI